MIRFGGRVNYDLVSSSSRDQRLCLRKESSRRRRKNLVWLLVGHQSGSRKREQRSEFSACLLAKQYLVERQGELSLDMAAKAQGAPGLDIDVCSAAGQRIVGEVKTVEPYQPKDFGARQKASFRADFKKLRSSSAAFEYLFVTSSHNAALMRVRRL
jgi:hypothetical protein